MSRWNKLPPVELAANEWARAQRRTIQAKYERGIPTQGEIDAFKAGYMARSRQAHKELRSKLGLRHQLKLIGQQHE